MLNKLFIFKLAFVSASVLSIFSVNKATAQVIGEITVDPYNDSSYQTTPIEIESKKESTQKEIKEKVYINAPATPQPPQEINGDLTSSNKFLPDIPPISEPYSEQQTAGNIVTNENQNDPYNSTASLSVSVSPFDITPTDNSNNNNTRKNNKFQQNQTPTNETRTISVSPYNQTQPQSTNQQNIEVGVKTPENNTSKPKTGVVNNQRRRLSLKEALANSNGANTPVNYSLTKSDSDRVGSNSSLVSSLGNQKVYKVLVKVTSEADKEQVKFLYPEAFSKNIKGESFLQIGIFSSQDNVDKVSSELNQIGFKAIVNP